VDVCLIFFSSDTAPKIIVQRSSTVQNIPHRLIWSPHVPLPEEEEEEQEICFIVLSHGADVSNNSLTWSMLLFSHMEQMLVTCVLTWSRC
jgi:hypothetical protein